MHKYLIELGSASALSFNSLTREHENFISYFSRDNRSWSINVHGSRETNDDH